MLHGESVDLIMPFLNLAGAMRQSEIGRAEKRYKQTKSIPTSISTTATL